MDSIINKFKVAAGVFAGISTLLGIWSIVHTWSGLWELVISLGVFVVFLIIAFVTGSAMGPMLLEGVEWRVDDTISVFGLGLTWGIASLGGMLWNICVVDAGTFMKVILPTMSIGVPVLVGLLAYIFSMGSAKQKRIENERKRSERKQKEAEVHMQNKKEWERLSLGEDGIRNLNALYDGRRRDLLSRYVGASCMCYIPADAADIQLADAMASEEGGPHCKGLDYNHPEESYARMETECYFKGVTKKLRIKFGLEGPVDFVCGKEEMKFSSWDEFIGFLDARV